ncbi:MAG: hypothetical protein HZB82_08685 [Deltaproteobacteria bacterium]|nr:hypothetical protein [Deltaproteobacteria bacterium]
MKYVVIEFIDEYKAFIEFLGKGKGRLEDYVIVAIEPKLEAYLEANGVRYRNTLNYFDTGSQKRILRATEKVMEYIERNFTFTDSGGLRSCYEKEFAHYVRLYMNHMFKMLEIFGGIRAEDSGCELYACGGGSMTATAIMSDDERYLARLAAGFADAHNLSFTDFNGDASVSAAPVRGGYVNSANFVVKLLSRATLSLFTGKKTIFVPRMGHVFKDMAKRLSAKDRRVVFVAIDYTEGFLYAAVFNALSFFKSLTGRQPYRNYIVNVNFFRSAVSHDECERLTQCVDSIVERGGLFEYNGVDCRALIKMKVDAGLKAHLLRMLHSSHNLSYMFGRMKRWMVMSFSGLDAMAVAGELTRRLGERSLFVSHGAHPAPSDEYHEIELLRLCRSFMLSDYTHVALSSPVQEEHLRYFKRKYDWVGNIELKTGPLVFADVMDMDKSESKIRLGIPPGNIVLTHATTTKARHGERYYFLETLDEFFASLSDIVRCVDERRGVSLIIRVHPGFRLNDEEIKALLPASAKFIIHRDGPFSEALSATDVLISYSSTAIDEALMNKIPVLLYDRWSRYNHFKTGVFEGSSSPDIFPVCYVNAREKLAGAVEYMLGKTMAVDKKDFDNGRFRYSEDYSENLFKFVEGSLNARQPGGLP